MNIRILVTAFFFFTTVLLNAQVKKGDIETAMTVFPDVLTKTGSKLMIYSSAGNIQCVPAATKIELKETAIYIYEYYGAKKTELSRLLIIPYSSIKDIYVDSNVLSLSVFN